jgi:hypothetical protein
MVAGVLGWSGTAGTFLAYAMVSRGRLGAGSRVYALLNILGGSAAGLASVIYHAWPSAASNFMWAILGIGTLLPNGLGQRRSDSGVLSAAVRTDVPSTDVAQCGAIAAPATLRVAHSGGT